MQEKKRENSIQKDVLCLEKKKGETMGEIITRAREEGAIKKDEKVTFAGRLDPLASGIVILLRNKARFRKEAFLSLPKVYEFEMVMGIETDSLDVLGKITRIGSENEPVDNHKTFAILKKSLHLFLGWKKQTYPLYSSKTLNGKPLFEYAQNNIIVERPSRRVCIYALELISVNTVKKKDFLNSVMSSVSKVRGNFRQEEILKSWKDHSNFLPSSINKYKFRVECSSGTYVRALSMDIALIFNTYAITDNIYRISVGEFTKQEIVV